MGEMFERNKRAGRGARVSVSIQFTGKSMRSLELRMLGQVVQFWNRGQTTRIGPLMESCTASCPGKVLIVGGYLVLQDGVPGLVISTSARFFSQLRWLSAGPVASAPNLDVVSVEIHSAQFHSTWHYGLRTASPFVLVPAATAGTVPPPRNVFAECAINCALAAAAALLSPGDLAARLVAAAAAGRLLRIDLAADNDFYSQVGRGVPILARLHPHADCARARAARAPRLSRPPRLPRVARLAAQVHPSASGARRKGRRAQDGPRLVRRAHVFARRCAAGPAWGRAAARGGGGG